MANIENVALGPCEVTFNDVSLGHTIGGVTVSYEPNYHPIYVDKYGETPVEVVLVGESLTATVPLAESTIENWEVAIATATDDGTNARADIGQAAGARLSDSAGELVIHPEVMGDETSQDVVMYKAISYESVEVGFNNDGETIVEVTFKALIDEDKDDGKYLGFIGDSTA
jgi:hypothetical protein